MEQAPSVEAEAVAETVETNKAPEETITTRITFGVELPERPTICKKTEIDVLERIRNVPLLGISAFYCYGRVHVLNTKNNDRTSIIFRFDKTLTVAELFTEIWKTFEKERESEGKRGGKDEKSRDEDDKSEDEDETIVLERRLQIVDFPEPVKEGNISLSAPFI